MQGFCDWWASLAGQLGCTADCAAAACAQTYQLLADQCPSEFTALSQCGMHPDNQAGWACLDTTPWGNCPALDTDTYCTQEFAALTVCIDG